MDSVTDFVGCQEAVQIQASCQARVFMCEELMNTPQNHQNTNPVFHKAVAHSRSAIS